MNRNINSSPYFTNEIKNYITVEKGYFALSSLFYLYFIIIGKLFIHDLYNIIESKVVYKRK